MPPVPNNYPKEYSAQEQQLMDQISARRKAYLQKYGSAETSYINADKSRMVTDRVHTYDYEPTDHGAGPDEMAITKRLFGGKQSLFTKEGYSDQSVVNQLFK
jgi:hypothetical protein